MREDVLLFDLGGVLVESSIFPLLRGLLPTAPEADLYDRWLESEAVTEFERGELDEHAFARRFVAEWRVNLAPQDFLTAFAAGVRGPFAGGLALLERLRPHYVLACLSNCNLTHWPLVEPVAPHFDHVVVSHLCGMVKPDPAIFRTLSTSSGGRRGRCVSSTTPRRTSAPPGPWVSRRTIPWGSRPWSGRSRNSACWLRPRPWTHKL